MVVKDPNDSYLLILCQFRWLFFKKKLLSNYSLFFKLKSVQWSQNKRSNFQLNIIWKNKNKHTKIKILNNIQTIYFILFFFKKFRNFPRGWGIFLMAHHFSHINLNLLSMFKNCICLGLESESKSVIWFKFDKI